ncbi:hypothetical protein K1719_046211 [Acacia pycnantha]|nr:hypothetical protein K1719_046211 [Acacia pycnantha]
MDTMRSLFSAAVDTGGGGESLMGLPIAKVFTMCFLGFLMASKFVNILPANGRKLLNGLVFSLLLPCLIFSQLGQAITLEKMLQWWFIHANMFLGSISGSLIGVAVALIVRPPYPFFKFTIVQIGIGNIGNVPLVLLDALIYVEINPILLLFCDFFFFDLKVPVKKESGQTLTAPLFQSQENIAGKIIIEPMQGKKIDHNGIKVEFL